MDSVGQQLRKARESKGLSIEEIVKITKISENSIHLIEDNRFNELPAPTYIKGFIRIYAITVGLDPKQVLEEYQKVYHPDIKQVLAIDGKEIQPPGISDLISKLLINTGKKILVLLKKLSSGVVTILNKLWIRVVRITKKIEPKVWLGILAGVLILWFIVHFIKSCSSEKEFKKEIILKEDIESSIMIKPQETFENKNVPKVDNIKIEPIQNKQLADLVTDDKTQEVVLDVEVIEKVWLRVYNDEQLAFEGILKKGDHKTWKAKKYFIIRMGNPNSLKLILNGKTLGKVGGTGKIRDIRLTKDGWYIRD